jgi:hypothetical protein
MSHLNQLLLKRLEKKINSLSGGGPPGPDSVGTSQIINGTITTADIADGAITQAKFSAELQLALAEFDAKLYNLENPGFYGTFRIKNDNSSDHGATLTITVEKVYFNPVTNTDETQYILPAPETINKGNAYEIPISIGERLKNKDTKIRMYYTINKADIEVIQNDIFEEDDQSNNVNGNYYDFIFDGTYDENNGGNAEIAFTIANSI